MHFIGEGSGHTVHVNNQPVITSLIGKKEMFLEVLLTYTENGYNTHLFFLPASLVLHGNKLPPASFLAVC